MAIKLMEFPQSHFCERVRWSLDLKQLSWEPIRLLPGPHRAIVQKIAPLTTLPVLIDHGIVVQGSDVILSYLDKAYPRHVLTPGQGKNLELEGESLRLEKELDEKIGDPMILIVYYWLFKNPLLLNHYYAQGMPLLKRTAFFAFTKKIQRYGVAHYDLTPTSHAKRCEDFKTGLQWLNKKLERSPFLIGNSFSRVDLAAASILASVARPPQHPVPWGKFCRPREVNKFFAPFLLEKSFLWSQDIYQSYRGQKAVAK